MGEAGGKIAGSPGNRSTHASVGPIPRGESKTVREREAGSGRKADRFPEGAGLVARALDSKLRPSA